jgi:hypothetical protein
MCSIHTYKVEVEDEDERCDNCGNCWDGYSQCNCNGIPMDDDEPVKSTHSMTLRSHSTMTESTVKVDKVDKVALECVGSVPVYEQNQEEELIHPECWNAIGHYGQCGQSCPCCRAEVGDEWGACLVCSNY